MHRILFAVGVCLGVLRAQNSQALFDSSFVHDVRIVMDERDYDALRVQEYDDRTYFRGSITIDGQRIEDVGFRQKGRASRNTRKPSFKIDFNAFVNQKFLGLSNLNLKSDVQDASQIKQRLAMQVFRRLGIAAPREAHAMVYVNGGLAGLYLMDEYVDRNFLERNFGEKNGNLWNFSPDPPYRFEYAGDDAAAYTNFQPESPDQPDTSALITFLKAVNLTTDNEFALEVAAYLDWREFLTTLAVENYLAEPDGIAGVLGSDNFFLYQFEDTTEFRFIPVDKDNTYSDPTISIFARYDSNSLLRRAMADPALKQVYLEALQKCIAVTGGNRGWMQQETLDESDQIRSAVYADPNKQCGYADCTNKDFEDTVGWMADYAPVRAAIVQQQIADAGYTPPIHAPQIFAGGVSTIRQGEEFEISGDNLQNAAVYLNGFECKVLSNSSTAIRAVAPVIAAAGELHLFVLSSGRVSRPVTVTVPQNP